MELIGTRCFVDVALFTTVIPCPLRDSNLRGVDGSAKSWERLYGLLRLAGKAGGDQDGGLIMHFPSASSAEVVEVLALLLTHVRLEVRADGLNDSGCCLGQDPL